jgi:hypothetical protein
MASIAVANSGEAVTQESLRAQPQAFPRHGFAAVLADHSPSTKSDKRRDDRICWALVPQVQLSPKRPSIAPAFLDLTVLGLPGDELLGLT